ncbi:Asp23/Gls24 family envelope stress response protein [Pasteuria penetrans]|uniref:Asp23/Gls24 family envelope stress response protein n=1 Tax=Pasteuria penetrans TaxID=86005 RepID=UPI000F90F1E3|nr:Asp23/Gls24 family envelope stress response protein [Pasteuria penetrans]
MDGKEPKGLLGEQSGVPMVSAETYGKIEIAPEVIQTIAVLSVTQVEGVHSLAGSEMSAAHWFGRRGANRGVKVILADGGTNETVIEVSLIATKGHQIPTIGRRVQEQVKKTVESMTGTTVDSVHVRIDGIRPAEKT